MSGLEVITYYTYTAGRFNLVLMFWRRRAPHSSLKALSLSLLINCGVNISHGCSTVNVGGGGGGYFTQRVFGSFYPVLSPLDVPGLRTTSKSACPTCNPLL